MHTIIGLGNPGEKYEGTRHNIGFMICDYLAEQWRAGEFFHDKYANALMVDANALDQEIQLVKPQTFMNRSGETVKFLVSKKDVDPATELLVIHDDVDLPLGSLRLAHDRGAGGHRGVRSVINDIETTKFSRLRVGISPADEGGEVRKVKTQSAGINPFVMGHFSPEEREQLASNMFPLAKKILTTWISDGKEVAMNQFNSK